MCLDEENIAGSVIDSRIQMLNIVQYLEANAFIWGEIETKENRKFKWLGQILSARGLADSVALTFADKEGKIRGAFPEIAIAISKVKGGFERALMLWGNAAFLASCMGQVHGSK